MKNILLNTEARKHRDFRQIARYLPHHRSENASKTHPKSSHDKFKTAS